MSNWPLVSLGEIFEIARGGSPRPIQQYITDDPEGINWIMIGDATGSSKYIEKVKKRIKKDGVSRSRMVYPGDFLLTNSMSFGHPYILQTSGCIHDGWLVLRNSKNQVNQDYFYHLLGSDIVFREFQRRAAGAVVKNLNIDLVKSVTIPLPPLTEQKRIAAILDKADAIRRKRQQAIKLAGDFLRATFLDMFGDPVTNPKGWESYPMGELTTINPTLPAEEKPLPSDYVSFVPMAAVDDSFGEITTNESRIFTEVQKGFTYFKNGDVLFAKITPCMENGKAAIAENLINGIGYGSTEYHVLRSGNKITKEFLFSFIHREPFRNAAKSRFTGSAGQRRVPTDFLKEVKMPLPPFELQEKYSIIFKKVREIRKIRTGDNINSTNLFNSLTQRAFRGEL
jgi:type I restriction enzyme S subunit